MKNLSKKEQKKLVICRERIVDAIFRVEEINLILRQREWYEHTSIMPFKEEVQQLRKIKEKLREIEVAVYGLNLKDRK